VSVNLAPAGSWPHKGVSRSVTSVGRQDGCCTPKTLESRLPREPSRVFGVQQFPRHSTPSRGLKRRQSCSARPALRTRRAPLMARPPLKPEERRTEYLRVRLTPVEKRDLERAAQEVGVTMAEYARAMLTGKKPRAKPPRERAMTALLYELSSI